jgi:hypothetical protein
MMVHAHEMMIMVIKSEEMYMEQRDQGKGVIIGFMIDSRLSREAIMVSS